MAKEKAKKPTRSQKSYKNTVKKAVKAYLKDMVKELPSPEARSIDLEGYTLGPKSQKDYVEQMMSQIAPKEMNKLIEKFPNLTTKDVYHLVKRDVLAGRVSIKKPKKMGGGQIKKYNYRRGGLTTLRKPKRG